MGVLTPGFLKKIASSHTSDDHDHVSRVETKTFRIGAQKTFYHRYGASPRTGLPLWRSEQLLLSLSHQPLASTKFSGNPSSLLSVFLVTLSSPVAVFLLLTSFTTPSKGFLKSLSMVSGLCTDHLPA